MKKLKTYRKNGAIGALLDEYEKSMEEFKEIIQSISPEQLVEIVDYQTKDEDCRSIQTILSHVVQSGYTYAIEIRKWLGEEIDYKEKQSLSTIEAYNLALDQMFEANVKLFEDYPTIPLTTHNPTKKIKVRWGQQFDVEQLMEHAIVHILRHRRQIERFKIKLNQNVVI